MNKAFYLVALIFVFVLFSASAASQIVYKIPDNVFPMDWKKSGFKGMLMLEKNSPSGLFIAYPEEKETLDQLRERAAAFIAPMVHNDAKGSSKLAFEVKTIPSHKGDVDDRGKYYLLKGERSSVQILFFERRTPAAVVLYGYFAQRANEDRKSKIWVGDDLKEPKIFKKFVESFKDAER